LATVLMGTGCGVTPSPSTNDDPSGVAFETELFTDDEDPALAGLSFVENELLVQVLPGAEADALAAAYQQAGVTPVGALPDIDLRVLRVDGGTLESAGESLAATGLLESIQKNYIYEAARTPNDPLFADKFDLSQIGAPQAWDITVGDEQILIAVVDTGVQRDHPDLAGQIVSGRNVYQGTADFSDVAGHGTGVAGMAAALSNNGVGVTGVAWNCGIVGVRVAADDGRSTGMHLAAGILEAVAEGAKVINVSFAPVQSNSVVRAAAQRAFNLGSLVIISSGNSGRTYSSPGFAEALFVGAVKSNNEIATFSDQGPYVDLVAPGVGVRTTALDDDYGWVSGTSFAAPIVSGVAALCWSVNLELRPTSIIAAMQDTARDLGATGKDSTFGHGIIDAEAAVEAALATTTEPDSTAPTVRVSAPSNGSRKSSRFTATASVTGDDVADVVLSIDDTPFATDTRKPYRFSVDPKRFDPGSHELGFVATDFSGNTSKDATITVTFNTSQTASGGRITFLSPADGSSVTGSTTIRADVTDSDGLTTVEWYVDGALAAALPAGGDTSTVSFTWRASEAATGPHTITLIAVDTQGRSTQSSLELTKR
jgi:subtilisin family serine protease